MIESSA